MSGTTIVLRFSHLSKASADRINEVLQSPDIITDGKGAAEKKTKGEIEFKHVSFAYPESNGECVLEDISFKVNKGETVAFIGSTGSGKSTLINLIPRFYDATKGQVLVDGIDVKAYKKSYLNDKNSQIIIEVPSSNDALITLYKSKAFSRFTWWGCHVFTYNKDTLIEIIEKAGYKVNYVKKVQRYGIFNHLYWLFAGKPGGHNKFKFLYFSPLEFIYSKFLSLINKTDTILISISLY